MYRYVMVMVMLVWLVVGKCVMYSLEMGQPGGVLFTFAFPLIATMGAMACLEREDR